MLYKNKRTTDRSLNPKPFTHHTYKWHRRTRTYWDELGISSRSWPPGLPEEPELPAGYFDRLEQEVLEKTIGRKKVIPMVNRLGHCSRCSGVALHRLAVSPSATTKPPPDFQSQLAELDWLDVIAMLESEDIDLSAEELLSAGLITADDALESTGIDQDIVEETIEVESAEEVQYLPHDLPELDEDAWLDLFEDDFGL